MIGRAITCCGCFSCLECSAEAFLSCCPLLVHHMHLNSSMQAGRQAALSGWYSGMHQGITN